MTRPTQVTDLGEVMQLAFVPADVDGGPEVVDRDDGDRSSPSIP